MFTMPNSTPVTAWRALKEGNERFVAGKPQHPSQGIERRASLAAAQTPNAVVFGCADSRVAAEIIFDQGLGDMTVVRTAGHVMGPAVLGSIEYAVTVLNVPLIVVLGHDSCGAVKATLSALDDGVVPGGYVRDVVERLIPSILLGRRDGLTRVAEFEARLTHRPQACRAHFLKLARNRLRSTYRRSPNLRSPGRLSAPSRSNP